MATRHDFKGQRIVRHGADVTVFSASPPAAGAAIFAGNSLAAIATTACASGASIFLGSPQPFAVVASHNQFAVMSVNPGVGFVIGVTNALTLSTSYRVPWRLDVPV